MQFVIALAQIGHQVDDAGAADVAQLGCDQVIVRAGIDVDAPDIGPRGEALVAMATRPT